MEVRPADHEAPDSEHFRTLLGVSEVILSHRDLPSLFQALAESLAPIIPFHYLSLVLHDGATNSMRLDVVGAVEPLVERPVIAVAAEEDPAGAAWKTQEPCLVPTSDEGWRHWPRVQERVEPYGVQSICLVPLTTARRQFGALAFACRRGNAFEGVDLGLLQLIANQAALAVENSLAFEVIEAKLGEIRSLEERLARVPSARTDGTPTVRQSGEIVGESAALRRVMSVVETVAPVDSTVLIRGETGTGKELVARALHDLSPRRDRPFVKVNCAAIPSGLLESELFGHEKGAFTGAVGRRVGRFELAHTGTLFLDEAGDIPLELQPKLLRVLQEREFERVGGDATHHADVRLIAATHRDLTQMVADGRFRADLFYRLNVFPIALPPLRDRVDDVPRLVRHFTQHFARKLNRLIEEIPTESLEALSRHPWPGNVRELQNVIERAVILSPGPTLQVDLSDLTHIGPGLEMPAPPSGTLADAEREHILGVLRESGWVLAGPKGAAARLGLKRSTLRWKLKRLGIARPTS